MPNLHVFVDRVLTPSQTMKTTRTTGRFVRWNLKTWNIYSEAFSVDILPGAWCSESRYQSIVFSLFLVKTLMSLLLEVLFYLFPHLEQRRNEKNRLQICLSFLTPIGLTEFQDSLLLMESGEGGISGSSSAHRGSIDLNSSPTITEEDEEEIQENSEKSVRQRQVEAELHHRRQLEIAEKRASIKEWVDFRIRSEIAKQRGPPLVDPIDNLEEQASIIEQIGPKSKDPTDLINVRRCLST